MTATYRNKQMDGLRCLAVAGVLIGHFGHFKNIYSGRLPFVFGVHLFYVISGYFITGILLKSKITLDNREQSLAHQLKIFYLRRTIRIFPIYYITIVYLYIINFQNTRDVFGWLVSYTVNIYQSLDKPYIGSFNHLWSLAVEEQFYLFWPLLILLIPQKNIKHLIYATILLSIAFKISYYFLIGWSGMLNSFTLSCADALGFGALIAYWSLYRVDILDKINSIRFLIPLSFIPFAYFIIYPRNAEWVVHTGANFLFSVFAFFIVAKASQQKFKSVMKFILENPVSLHLGKISYGIYLYHFFMPNLYIELHKYFWQLNSHSVWKQPFLFISSLLFAQLSWMLIEKPLLSLKERFHYSFR